MLEKNEPSMLAEIVWTIILLMAAFVGTGYLMKLISAAFEFIASCLGAL